MKNIHLTIKIIFIILYSYIQLSATPITSTLPSIIADNYLRAFPSEKKRTRELAKEAENKEEEFNPKAVRPPELGSYAIRTIAFNIILAKSNGMCVLQQEMQPVLNQYAWNDLKLFYGSTSAPSYNLMQRINRTVTVLGEAVLASLLVTPTANIQLLYERQSTVKLFVHNIESVKYIRTILAEYKDSENSLLSFYDSSDPLYTKEYRTYMEDYYYAKNNDASNKSVAWLEFKKRFLRDFLGIAFKFTYPFFFHTFMHLRGKYDDPLFEYSETKTVRKDELTEMISEKHESLDSVSTKRVMWTGTIPIYGPIYRWNKISEGAERAMNGKKFIEITEGKILFGLFIALEAAYLYNCYSGVSNYLEYSSTLRNLALRMSDVQAFIRAIDKLNTYISKSPELEQIYGSKLVSIRKLLARANDGSQVGSLVRYLLEMPYKNWSYFFNNAGKLLASHTIFVEYRDEFADSMYELGQLDAYVGMAVLVDEAQRYDKDHFFTFTNFLDRRERSKPYIKLTDMWNLFLDAKQAVGNDVNMGDDVRNITLTGPNAGGKSTFLTGVTTALLLSQSFGIAPAKMASITPFDKINTYIDIADDIAAGNSLFMAEVRRAQTHIKIIKDLKQFQFSFTVFDEPFSGTNPIEGTAAEYSILKALAVYNNSLTIVATHYPIVMLLEEKEKDRGFVNYRVFITENDKSLNYSYKVIPGKSTQTIAIRILEEQGFDTGMLESAKDIIKNPKKYEAKF